MTNSETIFEAGIRQAEQLARQGLKQETLECLETLAQLPLAYKGLYYLAKQFNSLDQPGRALSLLQAALKLEAEAPDLLNSLALTYWSLAQYQASEFFSRRALKLTPHNALYHANLGVNLLHQGRYSDAWPHFRQRHQVIPFRKDWCNEHRTWRGETLAEGTLLLYCSQGIGDIFLLTRYLPLVRERVGHIILEVDESCATLFEDCPWVDELRVRDDKSPPESTAHCEVFDLPAVFATTVNNIPPVQAMPFTPDPGIEQILARHKSARPGVKQVGIVWSGLDGHQVNARRSCGLKALLPLLEMPLIQYFSLQKNQGGKVLDTYKDQIGSMVDLDAALSDFRATATAIQQLDLVITVDTSVANLAGMLGTKSWVLLHDNPEWRWGGKGASPWYPHLRLFRQTTPGDWDDVIRRVRAELIGMMLDF